MSCIRFYIVAALLLAVLPCFADEPNTLVIADYNDYQTRLTALEEQIDALEDRIERLESLKSAAAPDYANPLPAAPKEPDVNALRVERAAKKVRDARDAIELTRTNIMSMPSGVLTDGLPLRYRPSLDDRLDKAVAVWNLLCDIDDNYAIILRCAEKNPELNIDILSLKKDIIVCRNEIKLAELVKKRLREIIRGHRRDDIRPRRNGVNSIQSPPEN